MTKINQGNNNERKNIYAITSRINHKQKEELGFAAKKFGISISAAVKILTSIGIKALKSI